LDKLKFTDFALSGQCLASFRPDQAGKRKWRKESDRNLQLDDLRRLNRSSKRLEQEEEEEEEEEGD
jgi:hypothetical protein